MDVGNEVTNYSEVKIEKTLLAPKKALRNSIIIQIERILKRLIDIIGGMFGVLILLPLTIAIYIGNKIVKDNGPIFYVQERIGKNGKIFKMYKYRSMVVGAEEKLKKYLEENEEARKEYKEYKKLKIGSLMYL